MEISPPHIYYWYCMPSLSFVRRRVFEVVFSYQIRLGHYCFRKVFYTRRDLGEYPMYYTLEDLSMIAPWVGVNFKFKFKFIIIV